MLLLALRRRSGIEDLRQDMNERFGLVDFKIDALNAKIDYVDERLSSKIDSVATDLAAHRADTESHPPF
jgi:hypothetical protein